MLESGCWIRYILRAQEEGTYGKYFGLVRFVENSSFFHLANKNSNGDNPDWDHGVEEEDLILCSSCDPDLNHPPELMAAICPMK